MNHVHCSGRDSAGTISIIHPVRITCLLETQEIQYRGPADSVSGKVTNSGYDGERKTGCGEWKN